MYPSPSEIPINAGDSEEQMKAEYSEVISLLRKGYSIRDVAKLSGKGVSTVQRVKRLIKVQSQQANWGNRKTKPASCGNASTFVVDLKYLRLP